MFASSLPFSFLFVFHLFKIFFPRSWPKGLFLITSLRGGRIQGQKLEKGRRLPRKRFVFFLYSFQ
jgi:hypothetical protein